jgi:hypothetical protein
MQVEQKNARTSQNLNQEKRALAYQVGLDDVNMRI